MAKCMYTVYDPVGKLYIHHNPHINEYIVSKEEKGCIVFYTKEKADYFINITNIRPQFFAKELMISEDTGISKTKMLELYDTMPH